MKIASGMVKFAGALGLVLGSLGALGAEQALDVLTLKDGRVVQGQVVDEEAGRIEVVVGGVTRTYSRDFVSKINYGGESDAPAAPSSSIAVPAAGGDALTADLAARYRVPESGVLWVRSRGVSDADLPEVLDVAADAGVSLRAVTDLRLDGWSWTAIRAHFGVAETEPAPGPGPAVVVVEPDPVPLFFRILLFPLFLFGWHGHWR